MVDKKESFMSIPFLWLPVLLFIEPPHIQQKFAVLKLVAQVNKYPELPIHKNAIITPCPNSCKPITRANQTHCKLNGT